MDLSNRSLYRLIAVDLILTNMDMPVTFLQPIDPSLLSDHATVISPVLTRATDGHQNGPSLAFSRHRRIHHRPATLSTHQRTA
jgi:hypothetical protein